MRRWDRSSDQGEDGSSSITLGISINNTKYYQQKKNKIKILQKITRINYCKKMTRKSSFRQSDITKALRAAKDAGYDAKSFRVSQDGSIDITFSTEIVIPKDEPNSWDSVFG